MPLVEGVDLSTQEEQHPTLTASHVQIALDESEQALFETLRATAHAYNNGWVQLPSETGNSNDRSNEPLVLRVAGGWVRDKLLQLQTHDVDIAVNSLTGAQAAQLVKEYLQYQKRNTNYCAATTISNSSTHTNDPAASLSQPPPLPPPPPFPAHRQVTAGRIGVIAANPAQSKHLETATMRIGTIDVDFCNLRGMEVYDGDSRIPNTTAFGTPVQDAMRRDFTLNALFYNLETGKVEDWTQRGLPDLLAGRLVTPLDPATTFRDDPLRVLRAIRFAVRYQFALDEAIENAAKCLTIHQALHVKVSRERVGKELEGMLSGKGANPILALRTISRLQLAGSVFSLPIVGMGNIGSMKGCIAGYDYNDVNHNSPEARHIREMGWEESMQLLDVFVCVAQVHEQAVAAMQPNKNVSTYDKRLAAVAAFLLPFRDLKYRHISKEKYYMATTFVFREGIKFKNADVAFITRIMETMDDMLALLTQAAQASSLSSSTILISRLQAGLVLNSVREYWATSLLLATTLKVREQNIQAIQEPSSSSSSSSTTTTSITVDYSSLSVRIYRAIIDMGLEGSWKMKPLLDGRALIQRLSLSQGPLVKTYHDEQLRWMLSNPDGTREDCEQHLISFKRKLEQGDDEMNVLGMSDGAGKTQSSPANESRKQPSTEHPHYSKKMHVESMDLS